ncbi:ABC transporter substrate-binding protein [Motiliproteus sp. MSK22-1]|uniref:substrate-binding periplasmic protein n=1 Tax=Motiliproteus sp. MSK22-1 TaxID=1897630 RepID=UPI0009785A29|nr:transporter substrate-binding domain-containing protein [Motiliproteus sp. MSK22-1]OMH31701.1 hypothetical protein BGP75_16390 [Motiliproteus sp. MSK22-1]
MGIDSTLVRMSGMVLMCFCLMFSSAWAEDQPLRILAVHYPPYEFENPVDGLKGFDVEVVEEAFMRLGKTARVEFLPWARAVEIVFSGQALGLLSCARNVARDPHLYYSDPISSSSAGYFFRRNMPDPGFKSLEELRGEKITSVLDYSTQQELEQLDIDHFAVRSNKLALNLLVGKRVDFYYGSKEANEFIAKQVGILDQVQFRPLRTNEFHLCFGKKWPRVEELMSKFNSALAQMKADGSYQMIHDRY